MTAPPPGPQWQQGSYGPPPHGQPPYGQPPVGQPPHGQPSYGQPPYGQPPYGPPPKKSRTGLVVALVAVFVLLVGGGVGAYLLLSKSDAPTTASPRTAAGAPPTDAVPPELAEMAYRHAKEYVAAVNAGDEAAATELTCGLSQPGMLFDYGLRDGPVTLVMEAEKIGGDTAVFTLEFAKGDARPLTLNWTQNSTSSRWCVR